jgi:hypothetical protein
MRVCYWIALWRFEVVKGPGSRAATGQSGRKRPTWAPDGDAAGDARPVLTLSSAEAELRVAEFQCVESHPIQMPKASQMTMKIRTANISVQPLTS